MVVSVKVEKSSGDAGFDDSVIAAVEASDPLPVPSDMDLFVKGEFREFTVGITRE